MIDFSQNFKKKKGNIILDTITILIVIVTFAIITIAGMSVFDKTNTFIQADPTMSAEAKYVSQTQYTNYPKLYDNLILFALVLLVIFALVSVFMLDSHPIFFPISIMLLIGVFILIILVANSFDDLMNTDTFAPYANEFPKTSWIMQNLLEFFIGVIFLVSIGLYIKIKT